MPKLNLIISSFYITLFLLSIRILPAQHNLLLRLGGGYYREFSGYEFAHNKSINVTNPYANFEKITYPTLNNLLLEVELEYILKQKFSVKAAYLFNMGAAVGHHISYMYRYNLPDGSFSASSAASSNVADLEVAKYPIYFQYKVADIWFKPEYKPSGKVSLWPMLGFSFNRIGNAKYASLIDPDPRYTEFDFTAVDGSYVHIINLDFVKRKNSGSVYFGINARVHSKKAEVFSVLLCYEQGFRPFIERYSVLTANGIEYNYTSMSKGSNFNVRLSFPVFSYNFTKKKFYRD